MFLQAFLRFTIVFDVNESLYLRVSLPSATVAKAKARYQRKRVTQSSVAKYFYVLRAPGLQKRNFLRAARARYQRNRVT